MVVGQRLAVVDQDHQLAVLDTQGARDAVGQMSVADMQREVGGQFQHFPDLRGEVEGIAVAGSYHRTISHEGAPLPKVPATVRGIVTPPGRVVAVNQTYL